MIEVTIKQEMTIFEIVEKYPETLDVFIANGFNQFEEKSKLSTAGKVLKLGSALKMRGYDVDSYIKMLEDKVSSERNSADMSLRSKSSKNSDINIVGLLPCPVRVPLHEQFDNFINAFQERNNCKVNYKFEAASIGADFLKDNIMTIENHSMLPDIFISAGFEAFFDQKSLGLFKNQNVFVDTTDNEINNDFAGAGIKDPEGHYSIISVVAAVFMVNMQELGDLPIPRSWADLMKEEYTQKVALPVGDFDLFNGILLNIYKEYGEEGVKCMGRSMLKSMHPSQMIKNAHMKSSEKPAVTIMPYFFTKMIRDVSAMKVIWPEDGAIIAPVFMLVKRDKIEQLKEIADFIAGEQMGEILAQKGLFPSLNKNVKNILPENAKFKWLGWDYIYSNDIGELIKITNDIFDKTSEEV